MESEPRLQAWEEGSDRQREICKKKVTMTGQQFRNFSRQRDGEKQRWCEARGCNLKEECDRGTCLLFFLTHLRVSHMVPVYFVSLQLGSKAPEGRDIMYASSPLHSQDPCVVDTQQYFMSEKINENLYE